MMAGSVILLVPGIRLDNSVKLELHEKETLSPKITN